MEHTSDRISIQVTLSGYSFKIEKEGKEVSSGWLPADRIFTTPEFQKRYEDVELSVLTPKATLVPKNFFNPVDAKKTLEEVVILEEGDVVDYVDVPQFNGVLIYSNTIGESLSKAISQMVLFADGSHPKILPELWYILRDLPQCKEYNKILASYQDSCLCLAIAQGKSLLLCNCYEAADFTTAEYYIFLAMNRLQLNPEVSTISFRTPLEEAQEMSLYRYFKSVEQI